MITTFKIFENNNIITQQPFYLSSDTLYISTDLAKEITPKPEKLRNISNNLNYTNHIIQKNIYFFENSRDEKGFYKSRYINTEHTIKYNGMYAMTIFLYRAYAEPMHTSLGYFQYYIGGSSGDHDMHGKNMVRATIDCNLNLMIKFYPIIKHIKNFYKLLKLKDQSFFNIIKIAIDNDITLAQYGIPKEIKHLFDKNIENAVINSYKYNL